MRSEHFTSKRMHSPTEYDLLQSDHARKKYISEQFAAAMANMSLHDDMQTIEDSWNPRPPTPEPESFLAKSSPCPPPSPTDEKQQLSLDVKHTTLVEARVNDSVLPMESKPGEKKLRIPDFILRPQNPSRGAIRYNHLTWRQATFEEEQEINKEASEDEIENSHDFDSSMDADFEHMRSYYVRDPDDMDID